MTQITRAQIDQAIKQGRTERALALQAGIKALRGAVTAAGRWMSERIVTEKRPNQTLSA